MKHLFDNSFRKPETQIVIPHRVAERASDRYQISNGCWVSTYSIASHGYAQVGWNEDGIPRVTTAHRAAWVYHNGRQIEEGYTIDHLCKNRRCVNPEHLRALPNYENARRTRGRDWKIGECINGHSEDNLYQQPCGRIICRPCDREAKRKWAKNNPEKVKKSQRAYEEKKRLARANDIL